MNNKISWTFSGADTENWILNTFNYIILFSPTVLKTLRSFQSLRNDNFLFFIFFYFFDTDIWCTLLQKYIFITHLFDARAYKSIYLLPTYLMHAPTKVWIFDPGIWCTSILKYLIFTKIFDVRDTKVCLYDPHCKQ